MSNPYQSPKDIPDQAEVADANVSMASLHLAAAGLFSLAFLHISVYVAPVVISMIYNPLGGMSLESLLGLSLLLTHCIFLTMICFGALRMIFRRSYAPARMAAEMGCIPLLTPFGVLGLPFAYWCLHILKQPYAKDRFSDAENHKEAENS